MGTPYTSGPHALEVQGGQARCIEIRAPSRGRIVTLKFEQAGGVDAACDFEVFTKREACPPDGSASSANSLSESTEGPASAWSIFGVKGVTAGGALFETDKNYPYQNNDNGPTNRLRRLYVLVNPEGSGAKTYFLTFEMDVSELG